jgi:3-keto-disaccharide hydrolase
MCFFSIITMTTGFSSGIIGRFADHSWAAEGIRLTSAGVGRETAVDEKAIPLFGGRWSDWQMAGTGRFNITGDRVLESEGGPGLFDWRLSSFDDNSGVYLRFPPLRRDDPECDWRLADRQGYEVQIDDRGYDPETKSFNSPLHLTGAIYKLAPALKHASRPVGAWNTFVIEAYGRHLSVTLNGAPVSDLTADAGRPLRGYIGLQAHHPGSRVQFRDLRIREC